MRLRFTVLASAIAAVGSVVIPSLATAAPHHNRALTIHAVPQSIVAGDQVDIIGRLKGADAAGQTIRLFHRINPADHFSLISVTKTDSAGRYEFLRPDGIVETNRNWFVRGPAFSHSKTIHEHVASSISIAPDPSSGTAVTGTTKNPIVFSGHVTPDHAGQRVFLQVSANDGTTWRTVKTARLGGDSNYTLQLSFRTAGDRDVRVVKLADARNTRGVSDAVPVQIQQTQVTGFSIASSDQIVAEGTGATITGAVDQPATTTPDAGASVSLYAKTPGGGPYRLTQTTTTDQNGGYSFNVQPSVNEWYAAKLTFTPKVHSAQLFQGVQDVVTMSGPSTANVDEHVQFTGSVTPDKANHIIYLQKLGADNVWHTVQETRVSSASTYTFGWTFGAAGNKEFRARILGGPVNVGAASPAVAVAVAQPALSTLPTG